MSTRSANYDKSLKMLHHKLAYETIFSYTLSDWFNKLYNIHFDQSAGSSHGVDKMMLCRIISWNINITYNAFILFIDVIAC